MYQNAPCLRYADAFREICQARVVESEKEALNASLVDSLSNATKLSELIDVWRMIGSECRAGGATELMDCGQDYKRLAEMPLKDMMKARAIDVMCSQWSGDPDAFTPLFKRLFQTADVSEQQLIVLVLPLLNSPERFLHVAAEATRTNIVPVFSAMALCNPFPQVYFDENQWNQMVLKAIFLGCDVNEIDGLHERHNSALSETIFQYISERHSASRSVPAAVVALCERALCKTSHTQLDAIKPELRQE
ncbi:MAG: hypothetical protein CMM01_14540 [Rhodopirellula sp.]|nr:hypothetical protein [Rhodopirellula sp.]